MLSTETDAYGNITVSKTKDTTSQISIGATANPYACIYVEAIYLTGDKKTYTSLANLGEGGTTNYNGLTNKPKINNVELASGNNTLSNLGIAARSHSHSNSDINWSTTLGYKGFGHNHTMIYDGNGKKAIAIAGSGSNTGLIPYDVSYNNADNISLTRGGTMYLGAAYYSNKLTAYPFECGYFKNIKVYKGSGDASDIDNYITPSGSDSSITGGLTIKLNGTPKISSWKGASDVSVNITASSIGAATSNHSHDMSSYATTSWVKRAFGSTIDVSNGYLYLYNNNGTQLSSVQLPTSSGGSSIPSHAIASDGTTRPIVTSGTAGSNTYTAWIGTYYESSNYVLKINGRWGSSSSWETHGFKSNYSDIRLKTNISNSNRKALDIINSIKIRQFDWIRSGEHQDIGFIADELETLDQHFTFGGGYEEDGSMNIKSVDSLYLQGYEVKAIQELSQENQKLKNTILSLQGEIAIIKQKLEELA